MAKYSAKERYYRNQAKKDKKKSSKSSSKIDYSNRPKGTSKREWYAQKTGGKLNYKTGKVTVAKRNKGYEKSGGSSNEETDQLRSGLYADGTKYGPAYNAPEFSYETYDTKNMFREKQREKASKVKNDDGSQKSNYSTSELSRAKLTPTTTRNNTAGNLFRGATNFLKGTNPIIGGISNLLNASGIDLSNYLGIDKALASESGFGQYTDDKKQVLGVQDQQTAHRLQNPQDISTVLERGQGPINFPGVTDTQLSQGDDDRDDRGSRRTPTQVDNPYQAPVYQKPIIPDIYSGLSPQSQPDYGNNQGEQGTVERMGGRGAFSTGEFANGGGGYGFQGTIGTGINQDDEQSLFNKILGIQTAQASEMPQQPMGNLSDYYSLAAKRATNTPYQSLATGMYAPKAQPTYQPQEATGGYQAEPTGGYQAQATGGMQGGGQSGFDMKGQTKSTDKFYKAQEKAQKKALEELIKSITGKYDESRDKGTKLLEKSKQQNMLRMSGLFGFANQDPNSEQRAQYESRLQNDAATQLSDFLANLMRGQSQDISSAKQGYQGQMADIASQRAQAMAQLQQQMQDYEDKMWERNYKIQQANKSTKPSKTGTYTMIPGQNGQNNFIYIDNYGNQQQIDEAQYMAGKYGVGIGNYGGSYNGMDPEVLEEYERLINGG